MEQTNAMFGMVQTRRLRRVLFDWSLHFKERWGFGKMVLSHLPLWITPNVVTIARTLLIIPILFCLRKELYASAFVIAGISFACDFVDGALANLRNQKTMLGAFLDPLADKIVVCGILLCLIPRLPFVFVPPIAVCCTIAVALTTIRLYRIACALRKQKEVKTKAVQSKAAGKLKMVVEVSAILLLLIGLSLGNLATVWTSGILLLVSVFFAGWSLYAQARARI